MTPWWSAFTNLSGENMTADWWSQFEVYCAVPGATLFVLAYGYAARWYTSLTGWALMTSKVGFAGLVWAALLLRLLGPAYALRTYVVLITFALIIIGVYLYLISLIWEQWVVPYRRNKGDDTPGDNRILDREPTQM